MNKPLVKSITANKHYLNVFKDVFIVKLVLHGGVATIDDVISVANY